jgi:hypothetical protein
VRVALSRQDDRLLTYHPVWVNYGSSKNLREGELQWRMPFAVQMVPGVLFVLAMLFQPESPRWLVAQGDNAHAAHALGRVTGVPSDDPSVQATITMMEEDAARRPQAGLWKQFRMLGESRPTAYAAFVASLVMFFQQWTGTNAINYYSPTVRLAFNDGIILKGRHSDFRVTRSHRAEFWALRDGDLWRGESRLCRHYRCTGGGAPGTKALSHCRCTHPGHLYVLDRRLCRAASRLACRRCRVRIDSLRLRVCGR